MPRPGEADSSSWRPGACSEFRAPGFQADRAERWVAVLVGHLGWPEASWGLPWQPPPERERIGASAVAPAAELVARDRPQGSQGCPPRPSGAILCDRPRGSTESSDGGIRTAARAVVLRFVLRFPQPQRPSVPAGPQSHLEYSSDFPLWQSAAHRHDWRTDTQKPGASSARNGIAHSTEEDVPWILVTAHTVGSR